MATSTVVQLVVTARHEGGARLRVARRRLEGREALEHVRDRPHAEGVAEALALVCFARSAAHKLGRPAWINQVTQCHVKQSWAPSGIGSAPRPSRAVRAAG